MRQQENNMLEDSMLCDDDSSQLFRILTQQLTVEDMLEVESGVEAMMLAEDLSCEDDDENSYAIQ